MVSIWRTYFQPGSRRRDGDGDRFGCVGSGEWHPVGSGKVGTGEAEMDTRFRKDWRRPHARSSGMYLQAVHFMNDG